MSEAGRIRAITGFLIVIAILVAFLHQLVQEEAIPPWLVLLVSVLGLGAGATLLGRKAIQTGYEIFSGGSNE